MEIPMRIFIMIAIAAIVVAVGFEAGHAYFTRSQGTPRTAAGAITLSAHDIHLNYKGMEKLPVHDVKDAF
jgi:hypothetical protein